MNQGAYQVIEKEVKKRDIVKVKMVQGGDHVIRSTIQ